MALSKTHAVCTALAQLRLKGKVDLELITYALIPDAIRCFGLARPITHFEVHPTSGIASGIVFPDTDGLKTLTTESIKALETHVEPNYNQVAIGDVTSIGAFYMMNEGKLPEKEFLGITIHLVQDQIYDDYIRRVIDVRGRYEAMFLFDGQQYDAKTVRTLIAQLEQQEFRILAEIFEAEAGITVEEFIEDQLFASIRALYSEKMAETTIKYINLDDDGISVTYDTVCQKVVDSMIGATTAVISQSKL